MAEADMEEKNEFQQAQTALYMIIKLERDFQ